MTKRKIQIIIGLMCLALIGLIGFQWYWIREAIAIRNEQFNRKVAESVQEVVHRLEKQEMMYLLQQRIETEQQKDKLNRISQLREMPVKRTSPQRNKKQAAAVAPPSNIQVFIAPNGDEIHYQFFSEAAPSDVLSPSFRITLDHQQQIIDEFFQAQRFGAEGMDAFMRRRLEEEKKLGSAFQEAFPNTGSGHSIRNGQDSAAQQIAYRKVYPNEEKRPGLAGTKPLINGKTRDPDRADLLREVMKDLMYTKRPIQERVNRFLLDTLLRKELVENGITLPFEFAVQGNANNGLVFSTSSLKSGEWQQRAYKASLFPNETLQGNNLLYVFFPDQQKYILSNMGVMFGGSGILIMVIMACFYMAVSTILHQKKLSDIKNDFINNMTHEFKTPISTIALAAEMAQENSGSSGSEVSPRITRYLGIIREENKRLGTHVEKVLQMALLDKGHVKLKRSQANIHDLIEKVLNSQSVQIEQKEGELDLDFEAVNEIISCDEVHISNVLFNLVDNAIKYSPEKLYLSVRTENENNGISIAITDHGLGMSKDQIHRIFDTFYRVPTGNVHDVKGFGLGLSYVKKMVEAHEGTIQVNSRLGQGSTFVIWLPAAPAEV
jgi:two-component system phosphate regulon sensor histidine kinase PhoR